MKIVFMGTPDYAVKTLEALIKSEHTVAAVFAQPDKPVGRKQTLTPPPVKVCAEGYDIPVYQPKSVRTGEVLELINDINPDVIVVVAYGKILPKEFLDAAKFGCVNGHASLLPKYRGASPIQWCIVCGEKETGITTMLMDEGMDTGDILETVTVKIGDNETAEELFERLSDISAELMLSTLNKLEKGEITPKKQEGVATYAPIIKKEMALLDFNKPANELFNAVRGYYSWPCAYFFMDGKRIKVIKAAVGNRTDKSAGTVVGNNGVLSIACGDGVALDISVLQAEGSKVMEAKQYLCGKQIPLGTTVGE